MKKIAVILLALSLTFTLSACDVKNKAKQDNLQKNKFNSKNTQNEKEIKKITGKELVRNKHARKAIIMSIKKDYIVDEIINSGHIAIDYFIPVNFAKYNKKDFREFAPEGWNHYNLEEAKKEWSLAKDELGFDEATLEFLTYDSDLYPKKMAEYIQASLTSNLDGLTVVINQQPFKNKIKLAKKGQFEMEYAGWMPDYPDPMTFLDMWAAGNGQNTIGFNNEEYNKIIHDTKVGELAFQPDKRWQALQRAEEILVRDEAVLMPIFQVGSSYVQKATLKGLELHNFGSPTTFKNATTEIKNKDGKRIIKLSGEDVPTLDSTKASNVITFEIINNCMENLVMLDKNDDVKPGVAKSWDISEDKKRYTFHLRKSKWSNGDPVTAHDFVYAWHRLADKATGSQYRFMIETIQLKNYQAVLDGELPLSELGVKALDDQTLEVSLEKPIPYFLKTITLANFAPLNQEFVEEKGEKFASSKDDVLYNGAYIIDSLDTGYGYSFAKNPNYWDVKNVKNDGVEFRVIKEKSAAMNLYENGELDRVDIIAEYKEKYEDDPSYNNNLETSTYYIIFNVGNDNN